MKKICCAALLGLTGAVLLPAAAGFAANVCGEGVGIPPFLSSGAKPNLLMVLDNSGSMLDAAYSEDGSFCFDDTYDTSKTYAGYFQNDQWYEWSEGDYKPWESGESYTGPNGSSRGSIVYVQGVFWEAQGTGTASGTSPENDTGLAWKRLYTIPKWKNATTFAAGSFVWEGPQLYYTASGGTSNDPDASNGLSLTADTGITDWKSVDSTWLNNKSYNKGDIVTYRGVLYEAANNATSSGTGVYDDSGVTWNTLDEGSFVAVSRSAALSACSTAAGATEKYAPGDLCISINNNAVPAQVPAFAARGNLLNWAMSSKFDVEKKILTGGKYNYKDDILVSEHRGCAGSRMVKQLQVAGASTPNDATDDKFLSLGVRASRYSDGPLYEDRIDSTDDTGRLEVLAITDKGYELSEECKFAIKRVVEKGLNGSQNAISSCLATFPDASDSVAANTRPTLNNSLQLCWQDNLGGQWQNVIDDCVTLYTGVKTGTSNFTPTRAFFPSELRPADGGPYLCYGVYDSSLDPNNRAGYMGRCWIQGGGGYVQKNCNQLTTAQAGSDNLNFNNNNPDKCWKNLSNPTANSSCQDYRNKDGFVEKCDQATFNGNDPCSSGNWKKYGKWDDSSGYCFYPQNPQQVCPPGTNCNGTWEVSTWPDDPSPADNCILDAINDYCDALKIPEVIDPSDTAGKTGDTGNMPGLIRDSYLMAYLGGENPMATMKGHIYQAKRPEGVVHRVAGDLRLGMMSFRYVGAKTECDLAATATDSKIEKYCPLNNMDGALLRTPLEVGDYVVDSNDPSYDSGKRRHVDDLAEAINTTRGTSWTPLAEAMYEAIGYYTQNINFCLNKDSSGECIDFPTADNPNANYFPTVTKSDPVQYWCQDNHILMITEGESTADINEQVKEMSGEVAENDPHILSKVCPGTCKTHGQSNCLSGPLDKLKSGDGDDADDDGVDDVDCTGDGLYTSSYLDNMTWLGQYVQPLYKDRCVLDDAALKTETEKQAIFTHVVTTGTLLNAGNGECNPETLMTQAAVNGGTTDYYPGENPQQLEDNLYAVFDDILSRSSAGSAASVISSSRSGSGAVYQAVFWPKFEDGDLDGNGTNNKVSWVGDVHSLFVDSMGLMYEDTNQDGVLDPSEDIDGDGHLDVKEDTNNNGVLDTEDIDGDGNLDVNEDTNGNGVLDPGEDIDGDGRLDVAEDVNNNGVLDTEDIDGDGRLDVAEDRNGNGVLDRTGKDKRIMFYFSSVANKTRGCYNISYLLKNPDRNNCNDPGLGNGDIPIPCDGTDCVELQDIKYLWSANKKLAGVEKDTAGANNIALHRKLFTWNDLNNNGIVDAADGEWFQLNDSVDWTALNKAALDSGARGTITNSVTRDFLKADDVEDFVAYDATKSATEMEQNALKTLTRWLQGIDVLSEGTVTDSQGNSWTAKELRPRQFTFKTGNGGWATRTWRLGDIIHSTPMVVAKPAESYHYIYRDPTYAKFAAKWSNRRNMIYFGGNDGMLHAVNGGFYFDNKFCCTAELNADGTCKDSPADGCGAHSVWNSVDLGDELWAYIPYNLQPHLKCLADRFYAHKFYVDLKPRIVDAQIFAEEPECADPTSASYETKCVHAGGWGTILIGGMHFGGAPVLASELNSDSDDNRKFISAYFVLDITNPEKEPVLLGEMTQQVDANSNDVFADMQYTTSSPTMIIMRDGGKDAAKTKWYLVLGSGPADQDGTNNSGAQGKLAVIPLSWLNGDISTWTKGVPTSALNNKKPFRIPDKEPDTTQGGRFLVPWPNGDNNSASFLSDIISVDYNIDFSDVADDLGARYCTDAIYFGTTDGTDFEKYPSGYLNGAADQFYWNGGGRVFRLVTKMLDVNGKETASQPSDWAGKWTDNDPLRLLADVKMPVVGAPSVGYDNWNYWVYAGTGRFYGEKDKTDAGWCLNTSCAGEADRSKAAMFGFKEPLMDDLSGFNNWASIPPSSLTCDDNVMTWATINWDINSQNNSNLNRNGIVGDRGLMQTDNILVEEGTGLLGCYHCTTDATDASQYVCTAGSDCFPNDLPTQTITVNGQNTVGHTFDDLNWYIAGNYFNTQASAGAISGCIDNNQNKRIQTGLDGWYHAFHDPRERNLGASALLGGLLTFTTYQPYNDKCQAEGQSYLYGIHFQTGTAWTETVFGTFNKVLNGEKKTIVKNKLSLGRGLSTTPSMHVGSDKANDAKAFIQTSTGEIIEVEQKNLPIPQTKSGRQNWNDRLGSN